jgi:HlyD family secretion protein
MNRGNATYAKICISSFNFARNRFTGAYILLMQSKEWYIIDEVTKMRKLVSIAFSLLLLIGCSTGEREITSTDQSKRIYPVEVAQVHVKEISETIDLTGLALPNIYYPIITQTPALVEAVYVNVGDKVKKGDTLIALNKDAAEEQYNLAKKSVTQMQQLSKSSETMRDNTALEQYTSLQQELKTAMERSSALLEGMQTGAVTTLDLAQSTLEVSLLQARLAQAAALLQQGASLSNVQLDLQLAEAKQKLKQAELLLENMTIKAPIDGYISEVNAFENGIAIPNTPVATIIQIDPIKATFQLNSYQISKVKHGLRATINFEGLDENFQGIVSTVSPTVNTKTNTFEIEIPINNNYANIKGGMKAYAKLTIDKIPNALVIPVSAILYEDEKTFVFIAKDGKAIKQEVTLGFRSGNTHQVLNGINRSDVVVTAGKEKLTTGALIQVRKSD